MIERITSPVVGFRGWRVIPDMTRDQNQGPLLQSLFRENVWWGATNWCKCWPANHRQVCGSVDSYDHWPPHRGGECGIYAHHDLEHILRGEGRDLVVGAVVGMGRVILHPQPDGWRAEKARIVALARREDSPHVMVELAARYNVPIVPVEKLLQVALEHGEQRIPDVVDDKTIWTPGQPVTMNLTGHKVPWQKLKEESKWRQTFRRWFGG